MWLLVGGSLAGGFTIFFVMRLVLALGGARWQAENTTRRSDILGPLAPDWKRTMLAVTGQVFARFNRLATIQDYLAGLRKDNISAGFPWNMDEKEILELSELSFVAATLLTWIAFLFISGSFNLFTGLALGLIAGLTPGYVIGHKSVERRVMINRAIPFSLDLLILTMEAGSSFLESIETLIESDPASPIAQEFMYFLQAVRHGKTRKSALSEMAERVRSEDLSPVVDAINTGEEMGTPVGRILRIQSEGIRATRSQRAEKLAAEASSKILFPTLLIMLAVLLMLMGPVIIKAVRGDLY